MCFHFVERLLLLRPVFDADRGSAFEGHVLEHVGEAGLSARIVERSRVHVGIEGDHRRFVALDDDEVHAVGEGEFGDFLFKFL